MRVGIDIGYNAVKVVRGEKMVSFPSIVGSPDESRFSFNGTGDDNSVIEVDNQSYLVGTEALLQSRFAPRRQGRNWINSQEYKLLFLTALAQITKASHVNMDIVTGLPINFYDDDKEILQNNLLGQHKIKYNNQPLQVFTIRICKVIPQPFGTLLSVALNNQGKAFESNLYATGNIGVIDIGGGTVNFLTVDRLREIGTKTESIDSGVWKAILAIKKLFASKFPDLGEMKDHEVAKIIEQGNLDYYDKTINVSDITNNELEKLANEIRVVSSNIWPDLGKLKEILITGGGALLIGNSVKSELQQAKIVKNPVYANAIGYWKFAQRF